MDWSHDFDMPIYLPPPERGELRTLLDAANYMLKLPRHMVRQAGLAGGARAVVEEENEP